MFPKIISLSVTMLLLVSKMPSTNLLVLQSRLGNLFFISSNCFFDSIIIVPLPVCDWLNCKINFSFLNSIFSQVFILASGKYLLSSSNQFTLEIFCSTLFAKVALGFNNFQLFSAQIFSICVVGLKTSIWGSIILFIKFLLSDFSKSSQVSICFSASISKMLFLSLAICLANVLLFEII